MTEKFYTKEHEWFVVEDNIATIGITDHAQEALGEIVYVELPEIGAAFENGDVISVIESVKAASDIYAPLSGEVVAVNKGLEETPEQVNDKAESSAWLFRLSITDNFNQDKYLSHAEYQQFLSE